MSYHLSLTSIFYTPTGAKAAKFIQAGVVLTDMDEDEAESLIAVGAVRDSTVGEIAEFEAALPVEKKPAKKAAAKKAAATGEDTTSGAQKEDLA